MGQKVGKARFDERAKPFMNRKCPQTLAEFVDLLSWPPRSFARPNAKSLTVGGAHRVRLGLP